MKKSAFFKSGNGYLLVAFAIVLVLFYSSSQTYEQQTAIPFLHKFLSTEPFKTQLSQVSFQYAQERVSIAAIGYDKFIEFFIRKGAHFSTYFLLGGSLFLGLRPKLKPIGLVFIVSWLSATGYAGLDEFHQMLTGGRTPLFQDVALDSVGALTACVVVWLWLTLFRKKR